MLRGGSALTGPRGARAPLLAGLRVFLLAVVLAGSVVPFTARPAAAQPAYPMSGQLWTQIQGLCAGPYAAHCLLVVGTAVTAWVVWNGEDSADALSAVVDATVDWWNGLGAPAQAAYANYIAPGVFTANAETIAAFEGAWAGVMALDPDWTYENYDYPPGTPYPQFIALNAGIQPSGTVVRELWMEVPPILDANGACATPYTRWEVSLHGHSGGGAMRLQDADIFDAFEGNIVAAATTSETVSAAGDVDTFSQQTSSSGTAATLLCSGTAWLRVALASTQGVIATAGAVGLVHFRAHSNSITSATRDYYFPATAFATVIGLANQPTVDGPMAANAIPFYPPANLDDLVGRGGQNPALPRIDGQVGPVMGATVGAPSAPPVTGTLTDTTSAGWWEGLFSGVRSAVTAVGSSVNAVASLVTALPGALVTTFLPALLTGVSDLFIPSGGWGAPWEPLAASVAASAPYCVVPGLTTAVDTAFVGDSSAITIPGFGPYGSMVIDDGHGWLAGLRTLTGVAAWFLLAAFALRTFRALFGSAPGAAPDD